MADQHLYPQSQRRNLMQILGEQIRAQMEQDDLPPDRAFIHVALDLLGYDFTPAEIMDGKGDYGIDFLDIDDTRASIFQFKSQDSVDEIDDNFKISPTHLSDLPRICNLLQNLDKPPQAANSKVQLGTSNNRSLSAVADV